MSYFPKPGQGRIGTTQVVDYTSVSAPVTSVFGAQTYIVRLAAQSPVHYHIYDGAASSTATSSDPLLPATVVEVIGVTPGQKVSFIKAAGGNITSADGRVTVTELT
jgi:hypothetical protein